MKKCTAARAPQGMPNMQSPAAPLPALHAAVCCRRPRILPQHGLLLTTLTWPLVLAAGSTAAHGTEQQLMLPNPKTLLPTMPGQLLTCSRHAAFIRDAPAALLALLSLLSSAAKPATCPNTSATAPAALPPSLLAAPPLLLLPAVLWPLSLLQLALPSSTIAVTGLPAARPT
ncbi:hypothetical protein COO60DRAFT_649709 [Scenedesmus sp. NREL 46B-D3]|nr:hypothetical protein COO60DRAFT_649709 [Scenedesmus sp. NREL 46B-D3]